MYTTGEYDECRVERTQESGECHKSCVQVDSGQKVNTTALMSVNSSCDKAVMYERQRSSAFIQLAPRRKSRTSDGLNTHRADVHRIGVRDEEVCNSARRERCGDSSVVEYKDPEILHLAHRRGGNAENDVEQNDFVESPDPETLHLAPNSAGPRMDTEVDRRNACSVVEFHDPEFLHYSYAFYHNIATAC